MKKSVLIIAFCACIAAPAWSQNWATVTAVNITDLNQQKLAAGQLCFLGTDQNDTPINFMVGGGGMVLKRQFCSGVSSGAVTAFTVPNPALTSPTGVYYRVTVIDSATGQEVLRYSGVTFSGAAFNFDTYAPNPPGFTPAPLSGTSVAGNLGVTGNITATGTIVGSNLPASISGTGSCSGKFVSVLNSGAAPTCSNVLNQGAATGPFLSTGSVNPAYIDGSSQTGGTGGLIEFTNGADTLSGYTAWILQNAFFNGTNWIQPRGTGTSSHGLAVSHHRNFSFDFAAGGGTNNAAINWTEWANLNSTGFNLETGNYQINGSQIAFSNIAGTAAQSQVPWATPGAIGTTTPNTGNFTSLTATGLVKLGRVQASGSAPTCSVTGAGSGATCTITVGSTDSIGAMFVTASTTSATSGTLTITFTSALGSNAGLCLFQLANGSGSWNARATIQTTSGLATSISANWDNNGVALANGSTYSINYACYGR